METFLYESLGFGCVIRSYPTYEEWKLEPIQEQKVEQKVLILPMRNGNRLTGEVSDQDTSGSYPTYEEWKRSKNCSFLYSPASSYPTYEEWKRG